MPDTGSKRSILPEFLSGVLWSYNLNSLDLTKDAPRIITNILLYGGVEPVQWLFKTYSHERIRAVIENPLKGEWDIKSLYFWAGYFDLVPDTRNAVKGIEPI